MSKYEFIKSSNIVSRAKEIELEYDKDYSGQIEKLTVRVYPYTVEEKLQLKNYNTDADKLKKEGKLKEAEALREEATYMSALYVFKKDDASIDLETIKKMPVEWLTKAIFKALEFEGVTEEQIKSQIPKNLEMEA